MKRSIILKAHFSPRVIKRTVNDITREIIEIDMVIGIKIVTIDINKKGEDIKTEERKKFLLVK